MPAVPQATGTGASHLHWSPLATLSTPQGKPNDLLVRIDLLDRLLLVEIFMRRLQLMLSHDDELIYNRSESVIYSTT